VSAELDEGPLGAGAWPKLSDIPPGVFYVCEASPHKADCYQCLQYDGCSYATWDEYKVKAGVFAE